MSANPPIVPTASCPSPHIPTFANARPTIPPRNESRPRTRWLPAVQAVTYRRGAASGEDAGRLSAVPLVLPPSAPCSFCDYLVGSRPYTILDRDDLTAILVTYEQRGLGHMLVIPVEHRVTVLDLSAAEQSALMHGVVRASQAIIGAFDPDGVAVWQNNGIPAHQSVPHVHFHVAGTLPGGGTHWGEVERLEITQTDGIAAQLRPHLSWATAPNAGPGLSTVRDGRSACR